MGYLELVLIAEEIGRALAPIPFSSSVYLATEALLRFGSDEQKKKYLPRLARGELIGDLRRRRGPRRCSTARQRDALREREAARHEAPRAPTATCAGLAVVVAREGERPQPRPRRARRAGRRAQTALESFDPEPLASARLEFQDAPAESLGAAGRGRGAGLARSSTAPR